MLAAAGATHRASKITSGTTACGKATTFSGKIGSCLRTGSPLAAAAQGTTNPRRRCTSGHAAATVAPVARTCAAGAHTSCIQCIRCISLCARVARAPDRNRDATDFCGVLLLTVCASPPGRCKRVSMRASELNNAFRFNVLLRLLRYAAVAVLGRVLPAPTVAATAKQGQAGFSTNAAVQNVDRVLDYIHPTTLVRFA
jgi:hypothetical protein